MSDVAPSESLETSTTPPSDSLSTINTNDNEPSQRHKRRRDLLKHYGIQKTDSPFKETLKNSEPSLGSQPHLKKLEPLDMSKLFLYYDSVVIF
jgi:hypothetical protein